MTTADIAIEWRARMRALNNLKDMTDERLLLERRLAVSQVNNALRKLQNRAHHLERVDRIATARGLKWSCFHCGFETVGNHVHPCPADDVNDR